MKITRSQLKRLVLKEFKINPDYADHFTGFNVDTILNPEEEAFNQKEVWGVRFTEFIKETHDIYMVFNSENEMIEFVNIYMNQPGLTNYLDHILGNTTNSSRSFFACRGVNDPLIKDKLCDSDTDSILIHDHSQTSGEALTTTHELYYNPISTPVTLSCR